MNEILNFAQTISPLGIIALLVIVIYQLINGKGLMSKIRGTQEEKYPKIEGFMAGIRTLTQQNEILLENHFNHEIPELMESQRRIESKLNEINNTLIRIDTKLK